MGSEPRARGVVGAALVPRGEFSIAIAGLATAAAVEDDLGPVTVAYVIFTVVVGSVITKVLGPSGRPLGSGGRRGAPRVTAL